MIQSALQDAVAAVREASIEALAAIRAPEAAESILPALDDPELAVQRAAIDALGSLAQPMVVDALIEHLQTDDEQLRGAMVRALAAIGDPGVHALLQALAQNRGRIKLGAIEALRLLKAPRTIPALVAALLDPDRQVRRTAVHSLQAMGWAPTGP